jgi:hypothetical protein
VRRILANLLCEVELARSLDPYPRSSRVSPPRSVLATVSRLGTLLRVFAREGDRLWTPAPVDPESLPELPGLPKPVLESGPLQELPPADEVLAWCETPAAEAHRGGARPPSGIALDAPLHELLWKLPVAEPAVVAAVNHRQFHRWVAEEIPWELPGAQPVLSMTNLDRALRRGPRSWVVKAPLSAAGRDRYIERNGPALSDPKGRRTVERLFARHGTLFFEPWMDRTADFGVSALLTDSALRIVGIHRQRVDRSGRFLAIDLDASLSAEVRDRLAETTKTVADCLRLAGYVGPFGIDAWSYRQEDGSVVLNPLGEINARMTFGLVAWTLAERLPEASDIVGNINQS